MAKKRLKIKDRQNNVVDYDVSAADVTLDGENGKPLTDKLAEMENDIDSLGGSTVSAVAMNGTTYNPNPQTGVVNLGDIPTVQQVNNKQNVIADLSDIRSGAAAGATAVQPADLSSAISSLVGDAGAALDTLGELADALNDDASFASTITTALAGKADAADVYTKTAADNKFVAKDGTKQLSTNDYTDAEKAKVASAVQPGDVANNLTTTEEGKVLDARQGKALKDYIDQQIDGVEAGTTAVVSLDNVAIVDSHATNSVLSAPSSRQMKMAYNNIEALKDKLNELYGMLAGIAFTSDKSNSWAAETNWTTPAVPQYTVTLDQHTGITVLHGNDTITTSLTADEGEVSLKLSASGMYIDTITLKDGNNNDVAFTRSIVDGYTVITFVLRSNVTLATTAVQGIQYTISGSGISTSTGYARPNTAEEITIILPQHHSWTGNLSATYGGTSITCTVTTDSSGNRVVTLPDNLNDTSKVIVITCNAEEDAHATLDFSLTNAVVVRDNVELQDEAHVYEGDTIYIKPAVDFKLTAADAQISNVSILSSGGNAYDGYSFTVGSSNVGSTPPEIDITATATALATGLTIGITVDSNINSTLTDANNTEITSPVKEGQSVKITLTPNSGYGITVGTATMGQDNISVTDGSNGVKTINVSHITGNIVVSATSSQIVWHNITKKLLNVTSTGTDDTTDTYFGYKHNKVQEGSGYTTRLTVVSGANSNNDTRVLVDGVELTQGTDYTFNSTTGDLSIPAAKITGDVDIVSTASLGVVTAVSNTSGATVSVKHGSSSTAETLTCDTDNGDGTYSGSLNIGTDAVTDFVINDKTAILKLDFGGALYTGSMGGSGRGLGNNSGANTIIQELRGLVLYAPNASKEFGRTFQGCSSLTKVDMIGWKIKKFSQYSYYPFSGTALKAVDLSEMPISNNPTSLDSWFSRSNNLSCVLLPYDTTVLTTCTHWFDGVGISSNESVLRVVGKTTVPTDLTYLAMSTHLKVLDIRSLECAPSSLSWAFGASSGNGGEIKYLIIGDFDGSNLSNIGNIKQNGSLTNLVCTTTTPPALKADVNWVSACGFTNIYVPASAVSAYTGATGWEGVATAIKAITPEIQAIIDETYYSE